jgi:galactokinase/galacturonokinase
MKPHSLSERIERLKEEHIRCFGGVGSSLGVVISPYRVCPLGAHVDHQLGWVSGMALEDCILLVFSIHPEGMVNIKSLNFPDLKSFSLGQTLEPRRDWSDYARGAAQILSSRFSLRKGINAVLEGNLPLGGLSSSAAVGIAYLMALECANGLALEKKDNVEFDRIIENDFIGLNVGVLDPSVILYSLRDRLLVLDCLDNQIRYIATPKSCPPYEILVAFSGLERVLVDTEYNKRVQECEEAAHQLLVEAGRKPNRGVGAKLRWVSPLDFERHKNKLPEKPRKRALHFFSECRRVRSGAKAWTRGDLGTFGQLMHRSGLSSVLHYECGCPPLRSLMEILNDVPGVYGARFSGAGFGGCCVGLSDPALRDRIREAVATEYTKRHPEFEQRFEVHFCRPGEGARLLPPPGKSQKDNP